MNRRLDSWKSIAAYLERDVTTARRWEKREGLPVHRHLHEKLGSVFAYTDEIDAWWQGRRMDLENTGVAPVPPVHPGAGASSGTADQIQGPAPAAGDRRTNLLLPAWLFASAGVGLLSAWLVVRGDAPPPNHTRFTVTAPPESSAGTVSVSPDSRAVVFASGAPGEPMWLRDLSETDARPLAGTEDGAFPFWAPDGAAIGYFAGGRLCRVAPETGESLCLADAPDGRGGTWNRDGEIVFSPGPGRALMRIRASGGAAVAAVPFDGDGDRAHAWPHFLPDGRRFLFFVDSGLADREGIYAASLDDREVRFVVSARSNAAYANGRLYFARRRDLVALPFDARSLTITGDSALLARDVERLPRQIAFANFATSESLVLFRSERATTSRLVLRDRQGQVMARLGDPAAYAAPAWSPDEGLVAVARFEIGTHDYTSSVQVIGVLDGTMRRVSSVRTKAFAPIWKPDGRSVLYAAPDRLGQELYLGNADGTGSERLVYSAGNWVYPQSYSSDGRHVLFERYSEATHFDVFAVSLTGDPREVPIVEGPGVDQQSQLSRDDRYVAFVSDRSGRLEVYVQRFLDPAATPIRVSTAGGTHPQWSDHELFYVALDGRIRAVPIQTDGEFVAGEPITLFDSGITDFWGVRARNYFVVSRDGQRFLFCGEPGRSAAPYTALLRWRPEADR